MKRTVEQLIDELHEAERSSWDGKSRCVDSSDQVKCDGHVWAVVSDHGNAELCHRGRNGRIYWHGGLV